MAEINRPIEFQRGTAGVPESAKEGARPLAESSDIGLGAGCRRFESRHSDQILEKPPFQAVFLRFRCAGIGIPPTVRIIVHRTCYDGTIPERQVRSMFYYSKRSHRKIVHTKSCFLVRGFDPEAIGTFETLPEALDAGYRLCRRCNPILCQYQKEQTAILDYCRENGMSFRLNDRYLSIISPISRWRVTVSPSGTTMLYHKNTELRASDAASAIRGYHNQHIRFRSLPEYFSYITSHDAFRMHHPAAPRAALAQKPPNKRSRPEREQSAGIRSRRGAERPSASARSAMCWRSSIRWTPIAPRARRFEAARFLD